VAACAARRVAAASSALATAVQTARPPGLAEQGLRRLVKSKQAPGQHHLAARARQAHAAPAQGAHKRQRLAPAACSSSSCRKRQQQLQKAAAASRVTAISEEQLAWLLAYVHIAQHVCAALTNRQLHAGLGASRGGLANCCSVTNRRKLLVVLVQLHAIKRCSSSNSSSSSSACMVAYGPISTTRGVCCVLRLWHMSHNHDYLCRIVGGCCISCWFEYSGGLIFIIQPGVAAGRGSNPSPCKRFLPNMGF
jgi:hypothetical protein